MVELYLGNVFALTVLECLHEEDFDFVEREIGCKDFSEFILIDSCKVDVIASIEGSFDDVQILMRHMILLFKSLHPTLNVIIIESLDFFR